MPTGKPLYSVNTIDLKFPEADSPFKLSFRGLLTWSMISEGKYVLYADDDAEDRETIIDMMKAIRGDLQIVCVDNGLAVIEFLDNLKPGEVFPCFVVLDINMPVMNGLEVLSFLKNHPLYAQIPVVIYTTSNDSNDRMTASALRSDDFITKPFKLSELEKLAQKFADMCEDVPINRK